VKFTEEDLDENQASKIRGTSSRKKRSQKLNQLSSSHSPSEGGNYDHNMPSSSKKGD
jgi:hypothetical protein